MSWSTLSDFRAQVMRLWGRGDLLRALTSDTVVWPLRLSMKVPSAADLTNSFASVRNWAAELEQITYVNIEWAERRYRVQGVQRFPIAASVDSLDDALALIDKTGEARKFQVLWEKTDCTMSKLTPWLVRCPLEALELADRWERLMAVVQWVMAHPRPSVYLRQVDVPDVDSKFIEAHRSVLIELLDLALPNGDIDNTVSGVAQFDRRYGFRSKPARIRFRLLDSSLLSLPGVTGYADIALDSCSFSALRLPLQQVFITENETNFLAFPEAPNSIVIFGAGYGWDALAQARWLADCTIHYWGDIDTHGFGILNQLRGHFSHVTSFLMDRVTLDAHECFWGVEDKPLQFDLSRLTPDEQTLYRDLRDNRIREQLRLEQERVSFGWLMSRLREIVF